MKHTLPHHSVQSASTLLLFFLFILFLLPVLILGAGTYRASVEGLDRNQNLYTASGYITAKFRQYDTPEGRIRLDSLEGIPALSFSENSGEEKVITYLYLTGNELKELFTVEGSAASAQMGTTIASLASFSVEERDHGLYAFHLVDEQGSESRFLLHAGFPGEPDYRD